PVSPAPPASAPAAGSSPVDERAEHARAALAAVRAEVAKAVVGQGETVTGLVLALVCRGHVLIEGVPGVAKTLLVRALAAALQPPHRRGRVTPGLAARD